MDCFICKKTLKNVNLLLKHLYALHGCNKNSIYSCPVCDQSFQNARAYKIHLNKKHLKICKQSENQNAKTNNENKNYIMQIESASESIDNIFIFPIEVFDGPPVNAHLINGDLFIRPKIYN